MKKQSFVYLFILLLLIACKKEAVKYDNGTITGPDQRECVCCGGWFVVINDSTWRFMDAPQDSDIDLITVTFPVTVELQWEKDPDACLPDEILVSYLRKK